MDYYGNTFWAPTDALMHHGIKGMKWGIRRYQNEDGSLTAAGKRRYGSVDVFNKHQALKEANRAYNKAFDKAYSKNYQIYSLNKKKREAKQQQWDEAYEKAAEWRKARKEYKEAKSIAKGSAGKLVLSKIKRSDVGIGESIVNRLLNEWDSTKDKINKSPSDYNSQWNEKPTTKRPWDEKKKRGSVGNI